MPRNLIRRTTTVPGAYGIGKVQVVYKQRTVRGRLWFVAWPIYAVFFAAMFLSYSWSRPALKQSVTIPTLRFIISALDRLRMTLSVHSRLVYSNKFSTDKANISRQDNITVITARSLQDLVYSQGFIHAIDRGYIMSIHRSFALGNLAAALGPKALYIDKFSRTLNFHRLAQQDYDSLSTENKEVLSAYAAGVNDALTQERNIALPIDFALTVGISWHRSKSKGSGLTAPWSPVHSLAVLRLLSYQWSHGWEDALLDYLAELKVGKEHAQAVQSSPSQHSTATLSDEVLKLYLPSLGGNIVAVSAAASETNSSLLFQDFHSLLQYESSWYGNVLDCKQCESSFRASGWSFPGFPHVLLGRNEHISWGFLASQRKDTETLYIKQALYSSDVPLTSRVEEIEVFGTPMKEAFNIQETAGGPDISGILSEEIVKALTAHDIDHVVLRSPALQSNIDLADVFHRINIATSPEQLQENAIKGLHNIALNFVFATVDGSIGSFSTANALSRPPQTILPLRFEYFDAFNSNQLPETDYLVASQQSVIVASDSQDILSLPGFDRHADQNLTISTGYLRELLMDVYSKSSIQYAEAMRQSLRAAPFDKKPSYYNEIEQALLEFDGYYSAGAVAPVLIEAFRSALLDNILQPLGRSLNRGIMGQNISAIVRPSMRLLRMKPIFSSHQQQLKWWVDEAGGYEKLMERATRQAISFVREHFGIDMKAWTWGNAHKVKVPHILSPMHEVFDEIFLSEMTQSGIGGLDTIYRSQYQSSNLINADHRAFHRRQSWVSALR